MNAGDRVRVGGVEYVVIQVNDDGEVVLGCGCCGEYNTVVDRSEIDADE